MVDWNKAIFELSDVKILLYLHEKDAARYYDLADNVIESRSTLATSLRQLQASGLIVREIKDTRPVQTEYSLTEKGIRLARLLLEMKKVLNAS